MSQFFINIDYKGRLFDTDQPETITWGDFTIHLGMGDLNLSTEYVLTQKEKVGLLSSLANKPSPPHWQSLDYNLHELVLRIADKLREGLTEVDRQLRQDSSAIRLPTAIFRRVDINHSHHVIYWNYDEQDLSDLESALEKLGSDTPKHVNKGLQLPLPSPFEERQVHFTPQQIEALRQRLQADNPSATPPSYGLLSIAWDSYTKHSFGTATIILAVSIETLLKWMLVQDSEEVTSYLIDNIPSPPLTKLLKAARSYKQLHVPEKFQSWVQKLMEARNNCVHKPNQQSVKWFEFGRWYAMGESIIRAINNEEINTWIGEYVELTSSKSPEINGKQGVVLRWEVDYGDQSSFHILLSDSTTIRAQENTLKSIETISNN